jgi:hypothetical protein
MCVVSVTHVPQTPLHYAVNGSCFELIAPLLRAGAKYVHVYACAVQVRRVCDRQCASGRWQHGTLVGIARIVHLPYFSVSTHRNLCCECVPG